MRPPSMSIVKERCEDFVKSFDIRNMTPDEPGKLIHDKSWKESEEIIADVTKEVLILLEDIWINPAFDSKIAKSLNEGTYQSTVILMSIRAVLKNLPFRLSAFISTSERQSIASADRKGEEKMGRRPDIMYVIKYKGVFFELMYVECLRLHCSNQKKTDDEIKLWRECNDGMYWVRKVVKLEKDQFGIVGVQIAGNMLHLNVLIRDRMEIHRYYHLQSAEIPVRFSDVDVVTKFVETLSLLQNLIITNSFLLFHGSICSSQRQKEDSHTVNTPIPMDEN